MKANQKLLIRDERGESDVAGLIGLIFLGIFIILAAPQISEVISDWQKATSVPEDSQWHDNHNYQLISGSLEYLVLLSLP